MKRDFNEFKEFIKNKKVAVVGIGVSNIPLINYLVNLGAKVTALDKKTIDKLDKSVVEDFNSKNVQLILGESYLDDLTGFDVVFKTPSMRIDNPAFVKAKESGAIITSEMEEFVKYCPATTLGITGSDGKTTTTSLVYEILKTDGYKTWVGGNIGTPLFSKIEEIKENDMVVLELSSFQLMTMDVSTNVAAITNLSPNHLDMHKDMDEYVDAKKNIYKFQGEDELLVINMENDITNPLDKEAKGRVMKFSSKNVVKDGSYLQDGVLYLRDKAVCKREEVKLHGIHNVENLLTAFAIVSDYASIESMKKVATTFSGVEHRCEFVREVNGVRYYNDSIASSPTRTVAGLKAFEKPVILIAGGYDKNIPFEKLAFEGYDKIKTIVILGATKSKIKEQFDRLKEEKGIEVPMILVDSLEEAVLKAKEVATSGDIITLSPACASFDMFPNFEARGNKFKEIVSELK
ncbi:UDP-N-acetylmuramoylalanine--D-glutamate ligase [Clostridium collagenovorans DSM 3089]|uniref:UDP-N-acetylmuramoylalanine--D-glutamate ligase n=1 Tax=Clostridium collagenovorans DSM 3089 TaxID=1121306 RepID=A0A1M5YNE3_9CLOT|nr:UDP-N-acetylmuramoyl-L-alanine--D-glutamate ligase [Clostridium collagenovorans]SHI13428.1 UDP-N-acetylmuramoylalanine--D-glutamate ligase [Clostridium collagenovorans DSM 3089]